MRSITQASSRVAALVVALALVAAACSGSNDNARDASDGATGTSATPTTTTPAVFADLPPTEVAVTGGTQELVVTGTDPGQPVALHAAAGTELLTLLADDLGQARFAYVPDEPMTVDSRTTKAPPTADGASLKPGEYRVIVGEGDERAVSDVIRVGGVDDVPDQAFFDAQELTGVAPPIIGDLPADMDLNDGFNYIETRDGTLLSAMVRFPDPAVYGEGPFPTLIEMEGYSASNPDSPPPGAFIGRAFGFATVAVNIRGTGCSGGTFDVFNPAQQADAYDVVEAVAAQDWVKGGKVGVVGLSYSGIMTLYAGAMNPPSLAAIAPQSVIPDPWGHQWPGGTYNAGFTKQWLAERDRASAVGGSNWVTERVDSGVDPTCEGNLALRSQNMDFETFGRLLEFRPVDEDERDLRLLVSNVQVPVFLTGAFQDEQTGPLWTELINEFTDAPLVRVGMWNGRHPDGYSAMNIASWYEFLALYVADEVPEIPEIVRVGAGAEFASFFDLEDAEIPPSRLAAQFGDDYDAARAFYEDEDPIRVVLESGTGENEVGEPGGTVELHFSSWPLPGTEVTEQFLTADGSLVAEAPSASDVLEYQHDPEAGDVDFFGEDGYQLFKRLWDYDWTHYPQDRALQFDTDVFEDEALLAGPSLLRVWMDSEADEVDVQVTLSEVRADGVEYWLQSGFLRVGHRAVDEERSEGLHVVHPLTQDDYEPLPGDELVEVHIGLAPVVAPIRAGSRLRVQIATPGRNHGTWLFESPYGEGEVPTHQVGLGGETPSSFSYTAIGGSALASLLRGAGVTDGSFPSEVPPCPSLRGQACRPVSSS